MTHLRLSELLLGAWLVSLATPARAEAAEPGEALARFALVIGSNESQVAGQQPLRFADDDAARVGEFLREIGTEVVLLTELDHDSQSRHPELVSLARRPTRAELDLAWAQLGREMERARDRGAEVELTIYYSGHGELGSDGQHYLTLAGGDRLTRSDLFSILLAGSPATHTHLIIDACRSGELVLSRGGWQPDRSEGDYQAEVERYLDGNRLSSYPSVGVLLATSADQQTHEWERYRGGVFTHELLSGLRGAADLNGDGRIEYSEIGAFVAAANSGVEDERARLEIALEPPANDERAPILVHERVADQRALLVSTGQAGRYSVEDERGVRVADFNVSRSQPAYLRLPAGRVFVFRHDAASDLRVAEAEILADRAGLVPVSELEFAELTANSRGSLDDALRRGLFTTAYGPGYYAGFSDRNDLLQVEEPQWRVEIWQRDPDTGAFVEVATIEPETADLVVAQDCRRLDDPFDAEIYDLGLGYGWLNLSVGTAFAIQAAPGPVPLERDVVWTNEFGGLGAPRFPLRGFEVLLSTFGAAHPNDSPQLDFAFRTGYSFGALDYAEPASGFEAEQPTRASYTSVPFWIELSWLALPSWPVRPLAGIGVGGEYVRLEYARMSSSARVERFAQAGVSLHGGLEARVTNYFYVRALARSATYTRRSLAGVPDFSNRGTTIVFQIGGAIPVGELARRYARDIDFGLQFLDRKQRPQRMKAKQAQYPPLGDDDD